jgi:hypothetical protein
MCGAIVFSFTSQRASVLALIHNGTVKKVKLDSEFKKDAWCEYAYEIDLDKGTISVNEGKKYTLAEWTEDLMDELEKLEVKASANY